MKNRILVIGGVGVGIIVIAVIVLSVIVKSYLKSDRLKALIVPRIEEFTGRKADMERIDVSLFKGITVKGMRLMERDGEQDFIRMKEFVLEYRLLPLLKKRLVIKRVDLISPSVRLVMDKDGRMKFSDILERSREGKREAPSGAEEKGLPLSVETDRISVRDARMTFSDERGGVPSMDLLSDIDLKLSVERRAAPEVSGKVKLRELTIKGDGSEIKSSGTVGIAPDTIDFNVTANIGKDAVKLSGDVRDYMKKPVARADINASELDLEKLMALSGGKKQTPGNQPVGRSIPAQKDKGRTKEKEKARVEKSGGLTASGEVKIGAAKYKGYILKDFVAAYKYSGDNVEINPVSAGISGEKGVNLQGTAKGELRASTSGRESAADSLKASLTGKFSADLSRCELKESKIGEAIALLTGIKEIASPKFDTVHFLFTIGNEKVVLNGTMTSNVMTLNPSGTVGFDKKMDVIADLRVAPGITGKLITGSFTRYVTDEKGWTVIPLRITGTTDKPSAGINQAALGKQLQKGATQEIEKRLFKGIFGK